MTQKKKVKLFKRMDLTLPLLIAMHGISTRSVACSLLFPLPPDLPKGPCYPHCFRLPTCLLLWFTAIAKVHSYCQGSWTIRMCLKGSSVDLPCCAPHPHPVSLVYLFSQHAAKSGGPGQLPDVGRRCEPGEGRRTHSSVLPSPQQQHLLSMSLSLLPSLSLCLAAEASQ